MLTDHALLVSDVTYCLFVRYFTVDVSQLCPRWHQLSVHKIMATFPANTAELRRSEPITLHSHLMPLVAAAAH